MTSNGTIERAEAETARQEPQFVVVLNHEEQYSIWPQGRTVPDGWREDGFAGSKEACLDHVEEVWTDMRPLSLRRAMDGDAK